MGGVAGHMSHIYENPRLTFSDIKTIFNKAASGELEGTEKTDGQNLFVSFSVPKQELEFNEGEARAARNLSNIKSGGMSKRQLANKFSSNPTLKRSFSKALKDFENVIKKMPRSKQVEIFGADTNIYYNAEIINPDTANVINYTSKVMAIHRNGGAEFDKETGKPVQVQVEDPETGELITGPKDVSKNAETLSDELEKIQQDISKNKFNIQMDAIIKLKGLEDKEALNKAISDLDNEISSEGITEDQLIIEYVMARILSMMRERSKTELDLETEKLILKRILLSDKTYRDAYGYDSMPKELDPRKLVKAASPKDKNAVIYLIKNAKEILKVAVLPIELIIHDFSVEMLKGLESLFILDNKKEAERIKNEVSTAIKAIKGSMRMGAIEILQKQMEKIKKIENIATAAEGFVFDHDGITYKFTGNFAPINQILGLFKYGRGNIPPMEKLNEAMDPEAKRKIILYAGRFQPMGRHHAEVFRALQKEHGSENIFIVTSNKVNPPRSPLDFEEKKEIMIKHGIPESQILQARSPYRISELEETFDPESDIIIYAVGKKDMDESPRFKNLDGKKRDGSPTYLKSYAKNERDLEPFESHAYVMVAPHVSIKLPNGEEMSGSTLRDAMRNLTPESFKEAMGWFDKNIYEMLQDKINERSDDLSELISLNKSKDKGGNENFDKFMKEYHRIAPGNPFNPKQRTWHMGESGESDKQCLVKTEIGPWDGYMHLASIHVTPRGECEAKGYASKVMNAILEMADEYSVAMSLNPEPFGSKRLGLRDLQKWYRKVGFKPDPERHGEWIREPNNSIEPLKLEYPPKYVDSELSETIFSIIEEMYSEKQRRWACSQMDDPRDLTKKQAKEMCYSKGLKKEEDLDEYRIINYDGWPPMEPKPRKKKKKYIEPALQDDYKTDEPETPDPVEDDFEFEELDELSSMAGGSVQGYSLPLGAKPRYNKKKKEKINN